MTSTNMFQGLDEGAKPSSRVLRPPGGGNSNIFGGCEEDSSPSRRANKMSSSVFAPPEQSQAGPARSNPPGGKSSGIFAEPQVPSTQPKPAPPGGATSNIFGGPVANQTVKPSHPNKPKDNIGLGSAVVPEPPASQRKVIEEVKEKPVTPQATPTKEEPAAAPAPAAAAKATPDAEPTEKNHEPRLGPRPRSHNRVLNPPGGKSSVVFY